MVLILSLFFGFFFPLSLYVRCLEEAVAKQFNLIITLFFSLLVCLLLFGHAKICQLVVAGAFRRRESPLPPFNYSLFVAPFTIRYR